MSKENLYYGLALVLVLAVLVIAGDVGLKRTERIECLQWQQEQATIQGWYSVQWQREQCKVYDINLK